MANEEHHGRHLEDCCEECLEFRAQWSAEAARVTTLENVVGHLLELAGQHFQSGCDGLAQELRRIARNKFEPQKREASEKLNRFIKESRESNG